MAWAILPYREKCWLSRTHSRCIFASVRSENSAFSASVLDRDAPCRYPKVRLLPESYQEIWPCRVWRGWSFCQW